MEPLVSESRSYRTASRIAVLIFTSIAVGRSPTISFAAPAITYVQGNYATPQTPQTSVSVTFTSAHAAGDLNIIVVGWNDSTATVSSLMDTSGNKYTLAVGPTTQSGVASQSIYYAKSILAAAGGANVVTVGFSTAAISADIRILEYSGADPNMLSISAPLAAWLRRWPRASSPAATGIPTWAGPTLQGPRAAEHPSSSMELPGA